jgi:hypothetical protein
MIYFYERRGRFTRCEIEMADDAPYQLIVGDADGSNRVEHFTSYADLVKRLGGLHTELTERGWDGPHGRDL